MDYSPILDDESYGLIACRFPFIDDQLITVRSSGIEILTGLRADIRSQIPGNLPEDIRENIDDTNFALLMRTKGGGDRAARECLQTAHDYFSMLLICQAAPCRIYPVAMHRGAEIGSGPRTKFVSERKVVRLWTAEPNVYISERRLSEADECLSTVLRVGTAASSGCDDAARTILGLQAALTAFVPADGKERIFHQVRAAEALIGDNRRNTGLPPRLMALLSEEPLLVEFIDTFLEVRNAYAHSRRIQDERIKKTNFLEAVERFNFVICELFRQSLLTLTLPIAFARAR